jgi:hypothetical protein
MVNAHVIDVCRPSYYQGPTPTPTESTMNPDNLITWLSPHGWLYIATPDFEPATDVQHSQGQRVATQLDEDRFMVSVMTLDWPHEGVGTLTEVDAVVWVATGRLPGGTNAR